MFTETQLVRAQKPNAFGVSVEAVAQNGNDATVLVVTPQNTIEEKKVVVGIQGKSRVEIVRGLNETDSVVIGNRSQYHSGEKVQPKEITLVGGSTGGAS